MGFTLNFHGIKGEGLKFLRSQGFVNASILQIKTQVMNGELAFNRYINVSQINQSLP